MNEETLNRNLTDEEATLAADLDREREARPIQKPALEQLDDLMDPDNGVLAEALALADALELVSVGDYTLRDNSAAILGRMLSMRLTEVRESIDRARLAL